MHTRQVFQLLHRRTVDVDEIKLVSPGTGILLFYRDLRSDGEDNGSGCENGGGGMKRVTHEEGSPQFSPAAVNLRPAGAGVVDIVIRYITRAE